MTTPLEGIRVLEVANFITGPYAGQLLADLGAAVIKIEEPQKGDPFRSWGNDLYSPHYCAFNRGKQSLTLNLRAETGREIFYRLIPDADVLIENFRPGVTDRLGIGYEAVREINPRLIYCSISGMGQSGPYAQRPAYDTVGQGLSGLLSMLMDVNEPRPVGPAFSDSVTGIFACYGIMGALLAREKSGRGQRVAVSMLSATLAFLLEPALSYFATGEIPGPYSRPRAAQVYAFTCSDGKAFAVHLSSPAKFWEGLTSVANRPDLREDPRFRAREDRLANYQELQETLAEIFKKEPRSYWLLRLEEFDVPYTPIHTLAEVFEDPQVRHLGLEVTYDHRSMGKVRSIAPPVELSDTPAAKVEPPPTLGEHTDMVLNRLGFDPGAIQRLKREGAI
ncbi:MAG: CoA transferase [Deltaproteobacteria bacterium]|nr:CoA transferase [Deltaproteobacteria bacterium]